jgi:hypothetical protein
MTEDELLVEKRGHAAIVTFNRPDRLNALSDDMIVRLPELTWSRLLRRHGPEAGPRPRRLPPSEI